MSSESASSPAPAGLGGSAMIRSSPGPPPSSATVANGSFGGGGAAASSSASGSPGGINRQYESLDGYSGGGFTVTASREANGAGGGASSAPPSSSHHQAFEFTGNVGGGGVALQQQWAAAAAAGEAGPQPTLHPGLPEQIWVLDPLTRKLRVPTHLIVPTAATATLGTTPSLCLAFLENRCRHPWCRQAHIPYSVVQRLRVEAQNAPTCCHDHHSPLEIGFLTSRFKSIDVTFHNSVKVTIPTSRLAVTVGLQRHLAQVVPKTKTGPSFEVTSRMICRLHLNHRCRYLEDCNNLHVCREFDPIQTAFAEMGPAADRSPTAAGTPAAPPASLGSGAPSHAGTPLASGASPPANVSPLQAGVPAPPPKYQQPRGSGSANIGGSPFNASTTENHAHHPWGGRDNNNNSSFHHHQGTSAAGAAHHGNQSPAAAGSAANRSPPFAGLPPPSPMVSPANSYTPNPPGTPSTGYAPPPFAAGGTALPNLQAGTATVTYNGRQYNVMTLRNGPVSDNEFASIVDAQATVFGAGKVDTLDLVSSAASGRLNSSVNNNGQSHTTPTLGGGDLPPPHGVSPSFGHSSSAAAAGGGGGLSSLPPPAFSGPAPSGSSFAAANRHRGTESAWNTPQRPSSSNAARNSASASPGAVPIGSSPGPERREPTARAGPLASDAPAAAGPPPTLNLGPLVDTSHMFAPKKSDSDGQQPQATNGKRGSS